MARDKYCGFCGGEMELWEDMCELANCPPDEDPDCGCTEECEQEWVCPQGCGIPYG